MTKKYITVYHGSPNLFEKYDVSKAGKGSGKKYGLGFNLSDSIATAVQYSEHHHMTSEDHYLYTVEMPELTEDNHLINAEPVASSIIKRAEAKLGKSIPAEETQKGKYFRKWIGMALTGGKEPGFEEEKAAALFLDEIGVLCNVFPRHQPRDGRPLGPGDLRNYVVFNPDHVRIVKTEQLDIIRKGNKKILVEGSLREIALSAY